MARILYLIPIEGMRDLACEQFIRAARSEGHAVVELPLRAAPDKFSTQASASPPIAEVLRAKPDLIVTRGGLGINWPDFFLHEEIASLPVAALWFDDPVRPLAFFKNTPRYLDALRRPGMHHFVWDGHWRDWLRTRHAVPSYPIHLAADPKEFYPSEDGDAEGVYFVGTLTRPSLMRAKADSLSFAVRKAAHAYLRALENAPYATEPYTLLEQVVLGLPQALSEAVKSARAEFPEQDTSLLALAWMAAKNETRKRALLAALAVSDIRVLSANIEGSQAQETELRAIVGETRHRVEFQDTSTLSPSELRLLYRNGLLHLQATDPQSVRGGIPFRVFQTSACGKPLLSDEKPELKEAFQEGQEMFYYSTDSEVPDRLSRLLAAPEQVRQVAQAARERFLADHTWAHRVASVLAATGTDVARSN